MEYIKFEGKRRGSFNYDVGGRIYQKKAELKRGVSLRCNKYKTCPGRALLCRQRNIVYHEKAHNCVKDPSEVSVVLFQNQLKLKASESEATSEEIYQQVASFFDPKIVERVPYKKVKSHMNRIKAKAKNIKSRNGEEGETSTLVRSADGDNGERLCDLSQQNIDINSV